MKQRSSSRELAAKALHEAGLPPTAENIEGWLAEQRHRVEQAKRDAAAIEAGKANPYRPAPPEHRPSTAGAPAVEWKPLEEAGLVPYDPKAVKQFFKLADWMLWEVARLTGNRDRLAPLVWFGYAVTARPSRQGHVSDASIAELAARLEAEFGAVRRARERLVEADLLDVLGPRKVAIHVPTRPRGLVNEAEGLRAEGPSRPGRGAYSDQAGEPTQ